MPPSRSGNMTRRGSADTLRPSSVLVIGDGPAACSAAIGLRGAGVEVRLTRPVTRGTPRMGDSLSPHGRLLIRRLGLDDTFVADEHLPCHANRSDWGSIGTRHVDFIGHCLGVAHHVDRERFDAGLRERVRAMDARFDVDARGLSVQRDGDRWHCTCAEAAFHCDFVIDASGRASWFARRQGARRLREDRQVALLASGVAARWPGDTMSAVESTRDGWWYSAPAPRGRWTAAFFTDPDLLDREWRGDRGWQGLLDASRFTRERLDAHGVTLLRHDVIVAADSARLDRMAGDGWLAVGDAAMSFDPLSSHGLTVALQSGVDAARTVIAHRAGDTRALAQYAGRLDAAFQEYSRQRLALYRAESRFADQLYWQRRHRLGQNGGRWSHEREGESRTNE
jgi:flavin-dependent dehydrogenase